MTGDVGSPGPRAHKGGAPPQPSIGRKVAHWKQDAPIARPRRIGSREVRGSGGAVREAGGDGYLGWNSGRDTGWDRTGFKDERPVGGEPTGLKVETKGTPVQRRNYSARKASTGFTAEVRREGT
jgi:hypothetical protein